MYIHRLFLQFRYIMISDIIHSDNEKFKCYLVVSISQKGLQPDGAAAMVGGICGTVCGG